jgi:hypothetical protein
MGSGGNRGRRGGNKSQNCSNSNQGNSNNGHGGNNIKASWANILTSVLLRVAIAIAMLIIVTERTIAEMYPSRPIPTGFLLMVGWVIALLSLASSIFAVVGVMQDRNL